MISKYHLASALGTLVNISALIILTEYFNIYYIISEVMAILFFWFELSYKHKSGVE